MRQLHDDWLIPTLETLLSAGDLAALKLEAPDGLWDAAVRGNLTTNADMLAALSRRFRLPVADLTGVSAAARALVPESLARKYRILPLNSTDTVLEIATSNPNDLDCERALEFATARAVRMQLAAPAEILQRIEETYRPESAVERLLDGMHQYDVESVLETAPDVGELDLTSDNASDRPIIRLVDHILAEGISQRASDIHLESQEGGVVVNYRIDGVLRQTMSLPRAVGIPLVSRIKIMSGLDIADRLRPQDGRARVSVNGKRVDLRISTLPASTGEKVVIRVLDGGSATLSLATLGLNDYDLRRVQQLANLREGIVLVTGPTGSGKTTTLYSALRTIQARGVNIVTVEDPVEYKLAGIVQVQVNEKAGLTFAAALRSILRQDPDVVLVGEIRDKETASIATQASLTGHLVLSTLHTIDAASAVTRLLDIGIESFKIAAALKGVVAQRLLRRLCVACRKPATDPVPGELRRRIPDSVELFQASGCPECGGSGYRGRLAVTEVLIADAELERRIGEAQTTDRIAEAARASGMRSLFDAGVDHVLNGLTDIDELLRVLEVPQEVQATKPAAEPRVHERRSTDANGDSRTMRTAAQPYYRALTPARPAPAQHQTQLPDSVFELVDDALGGGLKQTPDRRTVLLVEDEEPLRIVLRDLLEHDGFHVVEAGDGVVALDEIDRTAPDVVVLDLNIPRLDGLGVLSHLRSRPQTLHLPVVVLTAKTDEEIEVQVLESGADDFLAKPFRPRALVSRLKALIRRT
ncbi:MAG: Regulator of RpoS [Gemmatimonadaceae bacterium]|nr:Regulator of RpoS [Gemmatimonadaceae bacterium]